MDANINERASWAGSTRPDPPSRWRLRDRCIPGSEFFGEFTLLSSLNFFVIHAYHTAMNTPENLQRYASGLAASMFDHACDRHERADVPCPRCNAIALAYLRHAYTLGAAASHELAQAPPPETSEA